MIGMKAARKAIKPVFEESTQRFRGAAGRFVKAPKRMATGMHGAPSKRIVPPRALNPGPPRPLALNPASRPGSLVPVSKPGSLVPVSRPGSSVALRPGSSVPALRPGLPPPPKNPSAFAQHGKKIAGAIVAGGIIGGYAKNRTGKAVDPSTGLPKGVYGY